MNVSEVITSSTLWRRTTALWQSYRRPFLVLYVYAVLIHLPMLVLRLTNDLDGLWNQDDYVAGAWELSIGRWFWPWVEKLRFGVSMDPVTGIVALALYVASFLLILSALRIEIGWLSYLAGFLFLSNAAITCQMSFGYMVITFSLSTFLSVLAVWLIARRPSDDGAALPCENNVSPDLSESGAGRAETAGRASADDVGRVRPGAAISEDSRISLSCGRRALVHTFLSRILPSAACIALMMGLYQAEIGITCLVAMFGFLMTLSGYRTQDSQPYGAAFGEDVLGKNVLSGKDAQRQRVSSGENTLSAENVAERESCRPVRSAFLFAGEMLSALAVGAILYEILLNIHLILFNTSLSSYQSFSEIGPAYLMENLPVGVEHAYRIFRYSLTNGGFNYNILQTQSWFPIVYIIPAAALVFGAAGAFRRSRAGGLWYLAGVVLIPLFAGSFYILAPDSETHMQMLASYYLIVPLLICQYQFVRVPDKWIEEPTEDDPAPRMDTAGGASEAGDGQSTASGTYVAFRRTFCSLIFAAELTVLVWGSLGMTLTDQYAMYAGRKSSETLAEDLLGRVEMLGTDFVNSPIMILGTPEDSFTFSVGDQYYQANSYAQYGNWSESVSYGRLSWSALYSNYLRINVTFAEGDTEASMLALPEVEAMPVYPASGSIQSIYGVTVIKLGDEYTD